MQHVILLLALLLPGLAAAVDAVNPTGVNVNRNGVTTVFLTFQGTADQLPVNAFWCGEITVAANLPTPTNPCVPGTIFGQLPARNDLARPSGTGGQANTTDIMSIPASVARRAFQDAQRGAASEFFYVREFRNVNTGASEFIAVTCRMAGGGARVPFAITRAVLRLEQGEDPALAVVERGELLAPLVADLHYNGTGRLQGRWEIVMPGDPRPEALDLLPAGSLPTEQRAQQKAYTVISRFEHFLPPHGRAIIPGPAPRLLPTGSPGSYLLLMRIEATSDKEGDSATGNATAVSGGLAGFAMPVFRYAVAGHGARSGIELVLPPAGARLDAQQPMFTWLGGGGAMHRLELERDGQPLFAALIRPDVGQYAPPPFVAEQADGTTRWRVLVLDESGRAQRASPWRVLGEGAATPGPAR